MIESTATARKGKIARIQKRIRDQVNQRLLDGQPGSVILPWLNELPEVKEILALHFDAAPVSDQNLSDWRNGGFRDWQRANEESETVTRLTDYASELVANGRDPHDAANVIAGGRLLAALEENLDQGLIKEILTEKPADMIGLINSLVNLQRERRQGVETRLDVAKFQRETAELFLKWYGDKKAAEIAASKDAQPVKLEQMVQLMFGQRPTG